MSRAAPAALRRPLVAGAVLAGIYLLATLVLAPGGYLGTDTGAKVATLAHMDAHDTWEPDVGYWAAPWDPTGRVHPLFDTNHVDGRWVVVTTLPALLLAHPLYDIGGYRAALVIPLLGAVAAAFAARALARRLGGGDGWLAFWVVGLASSIVPYALDFWEHSIGVALVLWGVVALLDALDGRLFLALAGGVAFGAAATMRTEALVYAAVAIAVAGVAALVRRRGVAVVVGVPVLAAIGVVVPVLANRSLERHFHAISRSARAAGAVAGSSGSDLAQRAWEAAMTSVGMSSTGSGQAAFAGAIAVALLVYAAVGLWLGRDRTLAVMGTVGCLAAVAITGALHFSFVPGFLVAFPLAVLAPFALSRRVAAGKGLDRRWIAGAIGVFALPIVWKFQYTGGARPQWGGRYVLASALLLGILGLVALGAFPRWFRTTVLAFSAVMALWAVAWLGYRTHRVHDTFALLGDRPEDVLVSREAFFVREGGPAYERERWLTAVSDADLRTAVTVVRRAGLSTFAVIDEPGGRAPRLEGAERTGSRRFEFVGETLRLTSYRLAD